MKDGYYWRLTVGGRKYDPDQPRVPAGDPRGGQWTSGEGGWEPRVRIGDLEKHGPLGLQFAVTLEQDADEWAHDLFRSQLDGLTPHERNALYGYKADGEPTNKPLREGRIMPEVEVLDGILNRSRVPENMVVYKGLKERFQHLLVPGEIIELPDYSSTSLTPRVSPIFGVGWMEIRVPKGARGLYIEPIYHRGEMELLLPRGQQFKVLESKTITVGGEEWPYALLEVIP